MHPSMLFNGSKRDSQVEVFSSREDHKSVTKYGRDYSSYNTKAADELVDVFYRKSKENRLNSDLKYSKYWMTLHFWSKGLENLTNYQKQIYSISLSRLTDSTLPWIKNMNARSVATVANAVANLSKCILGTCAKNESWSIKMLERLAEQGVVRAEEMNALEVSNTSWAFATLGVKDETLLAALAQRALVLVDTMNPQNVTILAWAFATLGVKDEILLAALAQRALVLVDIMNAQNVSNLAWALATLAVKDETLLAALGERAAIVANSMNPQAVANTTWSLARMDYRNNGIFKTLFTRAEIIMTSSTSSSTLRCVAKALDYYSCCGGDLAAFPSLAKNIVQNQKQSEFRPSLLHKDISSSLTKMKVKHENESCIGYSSFVDILIKHHKLVIEVDGPHHEAPLQRRADEFKSKLLTAQGYTVHRISYRQWTNLDPQKKIECLQRILDNFLLATTTTSEEPYTADFAKNGVTIPTPSNHKTTGYKADKRKSPTKKLYVPPGKRRKI